MAGRFAALFGSAYTEQMTEQGTQRRAAWRNWLYVVIFESGTRAGRLFDVALLVLILTSVAAVSLESVADFREQYGTPLRWLEWGLTGVFTVEYVLRLLSARGAVRYARSFFGVVDLMAVLPSYLSFFVPGAQSLLSVRVLRLIRVFRILKLGAYLDEAQILRAALAASKPKITVFLTAVGSVVVMMGAVMYLVEGEQSGFSSIPQSMYWTVVTMTTVGYGDVAPVTPLGKVLAALLMVLGYGIIAVPTGIVSVELAQATRHWPGNRHCPSCDQDGHDSDARHCKYCGAELVRQSG